MLNIENYLQVQVRLTVNKLKRIKKYQTKSYNLKIMSEDIKKLN